MKRFAKYISLFILGIIGAGAMTSCIDEVLSPCESVEVPEEYIEGFSLGFVLSLDKDMATRADDDALGRYKTALEQYEDYIDTQNKFRVFFFNEYGDFLFGAIDRTVTPLTTPNSSTSYNWYVRIPMNYIVDRDGASFDVNDIRNYLRQHNFKVAVLANWPNSGQLHYDDSDEDDDDENSNGHTGATKPQFVGEIKGEPNWGWKNSILNPNATDIKNINDLHHLEVDNGYNKGYNENSTERPTAAETYDFIMDGNLEAGEGRMGAKVDWVKMRDLSEGWKNAYDMEGVAFSDRNGAEEWIKHNWSPNRVLNDRQGIYRHYSYLWKLWDFDAAYKSNPSTNSYPYKGMYASDSSEKDVDYETKWGKEWYDRNGKELKEWMNRGTTELPTFVMTNTTAEANFGFTKGSKAAKFNYQKKPGFNGIELPANGGTFSFTAHSSGVLRIKFVNTSTTNQAQIKIQRSDDENFDNNGSKTFTKAKGTEFVTEKWEINITGREQKVEISCIAGTVVIYAIEYVRDKYLYDTDREGVIPSESQPIPMYGVQNFDALGDKWKEGSTYNLSETYQLEEEDNNGDKTYTDNRKTISLIRSVAKVEVFLQDKASHIYMRSTNRTGRCEPMDVETPTETLWHDHPNSIPGDVNGENICEWFRIQKYGPEYTSSSTTDPKNDTELRGYTNFLSWYYYSWTKATWGVEYEKDKNGNFVNGEDGKVKIKPGSEERWNFTTHNNFGRQTGAVTTTTTYDSPHIFNPDINRSDYIHFLYAGEVGGYHKYVLYLPDKNIDDPNNIGNTSSIAKIPHVEYRYAGYKENSLDDNECHRIYFTQYSDTHLGQWTAVNTAIQSVAANKYEPEYEKSKSNLALHWPIMRNHTYRFYVGGSGASTPIIRVQVNDWNYGKVKLEW